MHYEPPSSNALRRGFQGLKLPINVDYCRYASVAVRLNAVRLTRSEPSISAILVNGVFVLLKHLRTKGGRRGYRQKHPENTLYTFTPSKTGAGQGSRRTRNRDPRNRDTETACSPAPS